MICGITTTKKSQMAFDIILTCFPINSTLLRLRIFLSKKNVEPQYQNKNKERNLQFISSEISLTSSILSTPLLPIYIKFASIFGFIGDGFDP